MSNTSLSPQVRSYTKEIRTVFLSQACFNFSFTGFKSLFVLYTLQYLGFAQKEAIELFAVLMTLSYASSLLGGYLSDKILKPVRCQLLGGALCILSLVTFLYGSHHLLYLSMAMFSIGSGCLKPNISALLASFFDPQDTTKDAAFTHLYLCMNIGNFLGPLLCSFISQYYGWSQAFLLIMISFIVGTMILLPLKRRRILDQRLTTHKFVQVSLIIGSSLGIIVYLLQTQIHRIALMPIILGFSLLAFCLIYYQSKASERKGLQKIVGYILCFTCFCSLFEQAGGTIMVFVENKVNRHFLGYLWPSSSLLSLNPVYILVLGLLLPTMTKLFPIRRKPLTGLAKISLGFGYIGISFLILALGSHQAQPLIPLSYVLLAFVFQTLGELYIVPITLSNLTRYGPPRYLSTLLSFWLMAIGYGHYLAGLLGHVFLENSLSSRPYTDPDYGFFFVSLATLSVIIAVILGIIVYRHILSNRKQT